MAGSYPRELRVRVVEAFNDGEGTYEEIGERFTVGRATVVRWVGRDRYLGTVDASPMGGARHVRLIDSGGEEMLRRVLEAVPDSTLPELVDTYEEEFGTRVGVRTMGRCVARLGITRKRGR